MRYLFFDIECCDGQHMCEFGYVIVDDKFNITDENILIIKPEKPFNPIVRKKLSLKTQTYNKSRAFPYYYNEIKKLITAPDQLILGYAIENDANFLKIACERYNKDYINFKFFDCQKIYTKYYAPEHALKLEDACEKLKVDTSGSLHNSGYDSKITMLLAKAICDDRGISLPEMTTDCRLCAGEIKSGAISDEATKDKIMRALETYKKNNDNNLNENNKYLFGQFVKRVCAENKTKKNLYGKRIGFTEGYENTHFKEMLNLVQFIADRGGIYCKGAKHCNIFVDDCAQENDKNFERVKTRASYGRAAKIIKLSEFLKMMEISQENLQAVPFPRDATFLRPVREKKKEKNYIENTDSTLLEFFDNMNADRLKKSNEIK